MSEARTTELLKRSASLVAVVSAHAEQQPERVVCTFVGEDLAPRAHLTYADIDRRARALAVRLAGDRGERAILLYPPGPDFVAAVIGCFYAGVVAVPVDVPRPGRESLRLDSVADGARPALVLTTSTIANPSGRVAVFHGLRVTSRWIATDEVDASEADAWKDSGVAQEDVALLQFTSGSTSAPKGAVITHGNLLANSIRVARQFGHTAATRLATWLPHFHDMGLIGTILHPILLGFPTTILSPLAFVQQPVRWLRLISNIRATTSGAPNFAYDLCALRVNADAKQELDLSSWEVAFNGAEPIRVATIERFSATFAECGFRKEAFFPCYGMAEATLFVSGGPKDVAPRYRRAPTSKDSQSGETYGRPLVSCGPCADPSDLRIVDPETLAVQPPATVGEIWLRGPCVARGYWQAEAIETAAFEARLPGDNGGPFFRTGDLGFLAEGELYLAGRLSDIVIIAGVNHHPDDIERTIDACHPWVTTGRSLAFGVDADGEERLVVALELNRHEWAAVAAQERARPGASRRSPRSSFDPQRLIGDVRAAVLRDHGVRVHDLILLPPGGLPRTTSGKLRRQAFSAAYRAGKQPAPVGRFSPRAAPAPGPIADGRLSG